MLLENKKLVLMGVRNKWSIAWGAAKSAHDNAHITQKKVQKN